MPNPMLNEKKLEADRAGWAAPTAPSPGGEVWAPPAPPGDRVDRVDDGPVTPWRPGMMTVNGTITATAALFVLLLVSATFGWMSTESSPAGDSEFPWVAMLGVIVGFGAVIALYFRPRWAKVLGPIYALGQGFFVGAISKVFNDQWDGIVVQAALATLAVFTVMLVLYRTRIIKVTDRFRRIVIGATLGVMLLYLVSFVISLFGGEVSFINEPSAVRHRLQRLRLRARRVQPGPRLRLHRAGRPRGHGQGLRVGRRRRAAGHHRVAVPRDPAAAGQAAPVIERGPDSGPRTLGDAVVETVLTAVVRRCARRRGVVARRSRLAGCDRRRRQRRRVRRQEDVRMAHAHGSAGVRPRLDLGGTDERRRAWSPTSWPGSARTGAVTSPS